MSARQPGRRYLLGILIAAAGWLVGTLPAAAIEAPSDGATKPANILDASIADAALVSGPDGETRLLTVTLDGQELIADLLEREGDGWATLSEIRVPVAMADPGRPWLMGPDARGDYLLLTTDGATGGSIVVGLELTGGAIVERGRLELDAPITAAGLADTDADGQAELVLAGFEPPGQPPLCATRLTIVDTATMRAVRETLLDQLALHGATIAELDGQPGADLAAYATQLCGADGIRDPGGRIVGVSLSDGHLIDRPVELVRGTALSSAGPPYAIDLGSDGRHELIARDSEATIILDPAADWERTIVASSGALLAAAGDGAEARVVVAIPGVPERPTEVALAVLRLGRGSDGRIAVVDGGSLTVGDVGADRLAWTFDAVADDWSAGSAATMWRGDLLGDGCIELLVPLLRLTCDGVKELVLPGPAWTATRPLAVYGDGGDRRTLVAATVGWTADGRGLLSPSPLAGSQTGSWRRGPSVEFQLAELSARDLAYFRQYPVPYPSVERRVGNEPHTTVAATAGARLIVRIRAAEAGASEVPAGDDPTVAATLQAEAAPGEATSLIRLSVPPRMPSGIGNAFARVSLDAAIAPEGVARPRWIVTILGLNDWGELSAPVRQTIVSDSAGPVLAIDAPLLIAPWPFAAPVRGVTEPRARVSLDGGPFVEASATGRFEFRRSLAPWPQTLEFRVIDQVGNLTVRRVSLIGGFDYRRLPWQVLVASFVLVAVLASATRDARRARGVGLLGAAVTPLALAGIQRRGPVVRRDVAWGTEDQDAGAVPEIEDLPDAK